MTEVIADPSTGTNVVTDPSTGLRMVELSHVWGHGVPSPPGETDVRMVRAVKHVQHGSYRAGPDRVEFHAGTRSFLPAPCRVWGESDRS